MKGFWKDFKAFISKGNVIDLAIAVIVGGAFGKIVTSLVSDIIMPLISLSTGGVSISDWKWVITPASEGVAESALYYGAFIQTVLDFLIISFFIFLAIRILQKSKSKLEEITGEIKDDLKKSRRKRKKKGKDGEIVVVEEQIEVENKESVIETPPADNIDLTPQEEIKKDIVDSLDKMAAITKESNTTQEDLLREIRDLLKSK